MNVVVVRVWVFLNPKLLPFPWPELYGSVMGMLTTIFHSLTCTKCGRATPEMMLQYKLAVCLYKLYNSDFYPFEFTLLNFNQILTGHQMNFVTLKSNAFRIGLNSLTNRLPVINNKIPLNWLNMTIDTYKVKCKKLFLSV